MTPVCEVIWATAAARARGHGLPLYGRPAALSYRPGKERLDGDRRRRRAPGPLDRGSQPVAAGSEGRPAAIWLPGVWQRVCVGCASEVGQVESGFEHA